jgi:hypothetical protein
MYALLETSGLSCGVDPVIKSNKEAIYQRTLAPALYLNSLTPEKD